jgi:mannose-1-phosphate guanylyltransferase/mannose-6-phosphate isomerase
MNTCGKIHPVLLSGGSGSRLWPMSRDAMPKQFQAIAGGASLIQQSAQRLSGERFGPLTVIANVEHRFLVAEQLRRADLGVPRIVLEPVGRNTAAAAAAVAVLAVSDDPEALILLAPSDHVITDLDGFSAALDRAVGPAAGGLMTLFGIQPDGPATGYGYIRTGDPLPGHDGAFCVAAFLEKPDLQTAQGLLRAGNTVWNSGIFLLPAARFIAELERFEPAVLAAVRGALAEAAADLDFLRLGPSFATAPSVSIDYAVMERTESAAVVPASFGWTDVGSWWSLWEIGDKDPSGNVTSGDVLLEDTAGSYVRSAGPLVTTIGVKDLIVVATEDAVLVVPRGRDQDVKTVVERLKRNGHPAGSQSQRVGRPWGFYQSVHSGDRFQVKRITVSPGAKLSLQKHFHRAEHWIVVRGTARVRRGDEDFLVHENESTFLPLGCVHRLENPGKIPLDLIEVQSGSYLGEDDIVRLEDVYDRV